MVCTSSARAPHRLLLLRVQHQILDRVGDPIRISSVRTKADIGRNDIHHPSNVAADHGATGRHRLDDDVAERLGPGGGHRDGIGRRKERRHVVPKAQEMDRIGQPELGHQAPQILHLVPTAGDRALNGQAALTHETDGANQTIESLPGEETAGSTDEERIGRHVQLAPDVILHGSLPRRWVDAVIYDRNPIRRDPALDQHAPNEFRNGDDAVIQDPATNKRRRARLEGVWQVPGHHDRGNSRQAGSSRRNQIVEVMVNVDDIEPPPHRAGEDRHLPPVCVAMHLQTHDGYVRSPGPLLDLRIRAAPDHHVVTTLEQARGQIHDVLLCPGPDRHSARYLENPHAPSSLANPVLDLAGPFPRLAPQDVASTPHLIAGQGAPGVAWSLLPRVGRMRIVTNTTWFDGRTVDGVPIETRRISGGLREFLRLRHWDAAVLNVAPNDVLAFCLLKRLFPSSRLKIVAVDLILPAPRTLLQRLRVKLIGWLFRAVDRFIFYSRDTSGLQVVYGLRAEKIRYVPFKVNDYHTVLDTPTSDAGYILSCGRSYRDYATFCKALEGLPYSARIVATLDQLRENGTDFDLRAVPANVDVVAHDGASASWIDWIARSKVVVLPISADALVPAGISACLVAMALGKCVVVSDSPVTRGILQDGEHAVVVPSADPAAMRAAIVRVCEDGAYRAHVARTGREYALSLRDERRLGDDVVREAMSAIAR